MAAISICRNVIPDCLLPLQEALQDQHVGLSQDPFQMTASALGPEACEILHALSRSEVYFPQPSGSPKSEPSWPSKPSILRAGLPDARVLG